MACPSPAIRRTIGSVSDVMCSSMRKNVARASVSRSASSSGGVHLAFGDPYGNQTHADWKSKTHVDVLTRNCDVWIDDEQVIAKGQYLLEKFDLAQS